MTVRTRFAPSPTGYLHIGGVRTALFNWLFARQHGGQFLLRVDDTDQQRNLQEALAPILEGFRWLGLNWDEGPEVGGPFSPYFQSQRNEHYQRAVDVLLAKGLAYRDYATPEEVQAERAAAEAAKQDFRYSRRWMATSPEQEAEWQAAGRLAVVRLKMPTDGTCEFEDLIRGPQSFQWSQEQDHVIQRADGSFIYHLASVVDDVEFQITHVIRAIEHLSNTPRQIFIFRGLLEDPATMPYFAHIPFVAEPGSKSKLSKRKIDNYVKRAEFKSMVDHGNLIAQRLGWQDSLEAFNPVLVEFYSRLGYTPSAVLNYLLLLGWSLDDKTEDFTVDEMTRAFSLERVVKSPASFDPEKLMAFQSRHFQRLPLEQRAALVVPFLAQAKLVAAPHWEALSPAEQAKVQGVVEHASDRIKVAGDVLQFDDFFVPADQLVYDDKAFRKRLVDPDQAEHLVVEFLKIVQVVADFRAPVLKAAVDEFCQRFEIKIGDIIHALRVALTGRAVGFGVFESFEVLGREESLARMRQSIQKIGPARQASGC
jgi:glutamyl-tRNA synthetase